MNGLCEDDDDDDGEETWIVRSADSGRARSGLVDADSFLSRVRPAEPDRGALGRYMRK